MGEIRSQDKRDKLRLLYQDAVNSNATLQTTLLNALRVCDLAVSNGQFLGSTSEAGGSVSFQMLQAYTPVVARRLIGELCDCYDYSKSQLVASGNLTPADADINAQMLTNLIAIRQFHKDFTGLRYGVGFYLGTGGA